MPSQELAIIFDFGNVLALFDYATIYKRVASHAQIDPQELARRVTTSNLSDWARRFELGAIDEHEFTAGCCQRLNLDLPASLFQTYWADIFRLNDKVADLVAELQELRYPLVLGSNTNVIHARQFRRQFHTILERFNHLVLSHEIGHLKPAPEFYHTCVAKSGLEAKNCIFIDDLIENVEGARRAGLRAIHFRDADALRASLVSLGVQVNHEPRQTTLYST
jgi:putative hydrolase of the HAD superfamily